MDISGAYLSGEDSEFDAFDGGERNIAPDELDPSCPAFEAVPWCGDAGANVHAFRKGIDRVLVIGGVEGKGIERSAFERTWVSICGKVAEVFAGGLADSIHMRAVASYVVGEGGEFLDSSTKHTHQMVVVIPGPTDQTDIGR